MDIPIIASLALLVAVLVGLILLLVWDVRRPKDPAEVRNQGAWFVVVFLTGGLGLVFYLLDVAKRRRAARKAMPLGPPAYD